MNEREILDVKSDEFDASSAPSEPVASSSGAPDSAISTSNPVPSRAPLSSLSPSEERTWAMLAHLSVWANLVTGFLGVAAALLIYLLYKDRSRYVAYQSLQAFFFQLIFWAGGGILIGITWALVGALSVVIIGFFLIPVAILLTILFLVMPVVALVYGTVGGLQCDEGADFRYWLVGEWVRQIA